MNWEGPNLVYQVPPEMWGEDVNIRSVWAPEMHKYEGKYYLFLTFDSSSEFPEQWDQWFTWPPRVRRASQVLVSDIRMPGGSGLELLAQVKQRQPLARGQLPGGPTV